MLRNTKLTFGLVTQTLHWLTAALIMVMILLGIYMGDLPETSTVEAIDKAWFYSLHKSLGLTVFVVALARVVWAALEVRPKPLNSDRPLEYLTARTVHLTLYGSILAMPLAGWLHHSAAEGFAPIWWLVSFDLPLVPKNPQLAEFFGNLHFFIAILLGTSICLHICGVLKHTFIDRNQILRRMLPGFSRDPAVNTLAPDGPEPRFRRMPTLVALGLFAIAGAAAFADLQFGRLKPSSADLSTASHAGWKLNQEKSRLAIEIVQVGQPVGGHFKNWTAAIKFDPDDLAAAEVEVKVDVASLSLGSVSEKAISADFLNAALHPVATFTSTDFVHIGNQTFQARGVLNLAGLTRQLTLPFELKLDGGQAFVKGETKVQRLDFAIGEQGFKTDRMLGFHVIIRITLQAKAISKD